MIPALPHIRTGRAALAVTLISLWSFPLTTAAGPKEPNVLLITIDTVREDRVGCYGYRQAHTPNLDALAREGALFQTVVTSVPLTLPSHCTIMTGTYPPLHGVRDNLGYKLGDSPPTLAAILKQRGYSTAAFVGADVLDPSRGLNRGFDTYSGPFKRKMGRNNPLVFNLEELQRRAGEVVDDALGWMSRQPGSKPFFVWIHLYDPHAPYDPPPRFRALLRDPYDGEIAYADDAIGKVFEYLKAHALYDPTLIVAASDHGESFGEHGEYTHGFFIYDTTLLVPLIIKPPLDARAGHRRIETPVQTIDIAPTVLQFLGVAPPSSMQGRSLMSLVLGKAPASPRNAYSETYYPTEFGWSALRALRSGHYKYIDAPKPELYDLAADPKETRNLYGSKRATAVELRSQFESLVARVTPQKPPLRPAPSPADVELLASLGYVGTSDALPAGNSAGRPLHDPKDELGAFRILNSAAQMAATGKCERSIPLLARLTEEQPSLFLGQMTLAKCQLSSGNYEAAESALDAALHLRPENLEAHFYRGICQFQEGKLQDSLASLQSVAKVLHDEPYVHFYLGMIDEKEGNAEQALAEFQRCAAIDPGFEAAVFRVAYYLVKSGKSADAVVEFRKVIAMDPENADAHHDLAIAYAKQGNETEAQAEFEAACRLQASFCPQANPQ